MRISGKIGFMAMVVSTVFDCYGTLCRIISSSIYYLTSQNKLVSKSLPSREQNSPIVGRFLIFNNTENDCILLLRQSKHRKLQKNQIRNL